MLKNYTGSDLRHLEYQAKPGWEGSLWEDGYVHICGWIRAYMWMDTCIYVAELLCCAPGTVTTLLIGYTPI